MVTSEITELKKDASDESYGLNQTDIIRTEQRTQTSQMEESTKLSVTTSSHVTEDEQEKVLEKSPKNYKSQKIPSFDTADSCETILQLKSFMLNYILESIEIEFQDIESEYGEKIRK